MKKFSLKYKVLAFILIMIFTIRTLESINSHTYGTGIYNLHATHSCIIFGNTTHMNFNCTN